MNKINCCRCPTGDLRSLTMAERLQKEYEKHLFAEQAHNLPWPGEGGIIVSGKVLVPPGRFFSQADLKQTCFCPN
jgi:hypothetical protein